MDDAKENHAKLGVFVLRLFPTMMQLILKDNITTGRLTRMFIDKTCSIILTNNDIHLMKMLPNLDNFTTEICYKILRFENLMREPKCKWGGVPQYKEVGIADDIQRILNFSNEVISKTSEEITTIYHTNIFEDTVKQIVKRVDKYIRSDDCTKMYLNLKKQAINTAEVLQKLSQTRQIKVNPSNQTSDRKSKMREFFSRIALVTTEIFPDILREIIKSMISAPDLSRKIDQAFLNSCFHEQQSRLKKFKHNHSFSSFDIPITYKLLRKFSLISPPSNGWGVDPSPTDISMADDVERIRILRNKIAHSSVATISKHDFDDFFVKSCEIGKRIDSYFRNTTIYKQKVVDCKTCLMDIEMQKKYEQAVKELENVILHYERKPLKFYWGDTFENNLMTLRQMLKQEKIAGNQTLRVQIVLQTESDMNDRTVSILNFLKDEINNGLEGVEFVFASPGSVVLCVDILVDVLERDEKLLLSLYLLVHKIIQTGVIGDPLTENVDVVLIPSEDNTLFGMTKNDTNLLTVVNLNFDINASHLATDEKMKTALKDILENVHQKPDALGIKSEIRATVMPLQLDFNIENISELQEAQQYHGYSIDKVVSTSSSITLHWSTQTSEDEPDIDYYIVMYRQVGTKRFMTQTCDPNTNFVVIDDLKSNAYYEIKVKVCVDGDETLLFKKNVWTNISMCAMSESLLMVSEKKIMTRRPNIYHVKPESIYNIDMHIRCCDVFSGYDDIDDKHTEKTIMLLGDTGSGKSTIIDALINYLAGVSSVDDFRFKLVNSTEDDTAELEKQYGSQTNGITCYRIPRTNGSRIDCKLCVIDTPGFNYTRGPVYDKNIFEMIKNLFQKGIKSIDALCLVLNVTHVRVTGREMYVFSSILELFEKDISDNMFLFLTHEPGNFIQPGILPFLRKKYIPIKDDMCFRFDNANLFNFKHSIDAWNANDENFGNFFDKLLTTPCISLSNTKAALDLKAFLEMQLEKIQKTIGNQVTDIMNITQDKKVIAGHEKDFETNTDFKKNYYVKVPITVSHDYESLNCKQCNETCHENCSVVAGIFIWTCEAMTNFKCGICRGTCSTDYHKMEKFTHETKTETRIETIKGLRTRYKIAKQGAEGRAEMMTKNRSSLQKSLEELSEILKQVEEKIRKLQKVALRPNFKSMEDFLNKVIARENTPPVDDNHHERVEILTIIRKHVLSNDSLTMMNDF